MIYCLHTEGKTANERGKGSWDLLAETEDANVTVAEPVFPRKKRKDAEDVGKVLTVKTHTVTFFTTFFAYGV